MEDEEFEEETELFGADPYCKHIIIEKWSGVECEKCGGWFGFVIKQRYFVNKINELEEMLRDEKNIFLSYRGIQFENVEGGAFKFVFYRQW